MINDKKHSVRELIGLNEYQQMAERGVIITDDRRRRPLWFDGRFLDAAALKSEQNYFLGRQADIARVAGHGVLEGLQVSLDEARARSIKISSGQGMTAAGARVLLDDEIKVDLADVAETQRLDARFGVAEIPRQSAYNRSGLYILALRPVEFTGVPIASYPTSINAERTLEDGQIIEATALTLIPYPVQASRVELQQRRQQAAREIFVDGNEPGTEQNVLPVAMMALNLGVIEWLDMHMVRREIGIQPQGRFGLGLASHALQQAYLNQYYDHLVQILAQNPGTANTISAADYFSTLPAVGPMPASAINPGDLSQAYFPPEMDVELSIIAEDELPALIDDSLTLPPIDLTVGEDQLESTSVLALIPLARAKIPALTLALKSLQRSLGATAPGRLAQRKPLYALQQLKLRRQPELFAAGRLQSDQTQWKQLLQDVDIIWYVRRRNIASATPYSASTVALIRDEMPIEAAVADRFKALGASRLLTEIKRKSTASANAEMINLFSAPKLLVGSPIAARAAISEISKLDTVDRAALLKISERYSADNFGNGINRLEALNPELTSSKKKLDLLAASGKLPELDEVANALTPREFEKFNDELVNATVGVNASSDAIARLIDAKKRSLATSASTLERRKRIEAGLTISHPVRRL